MLDLHNHVRPRTWGPAKFVFGDALKPYIQDGKVQFDVWFTPRPCAMRNCSSP